MKRAWIAASAALLLVAPMAQAGVGQGDVEVGASITITSTEIEYEDDVIPATKSDYGSVNLSGGYFYTDMLEFKLGLSLSITTDSTSGTINPGADFLFVQPGQNLVPFAGASYGLAVGDFDETDFLEVHGGVKYFFRERTSVEGALSYSSPLDSDYDATTEISVGLNVYF